MGVLIGLLMVFNVKVVFLLMVIVFVVWWMKILCEVCWVDLGKVVGGFVFGFVLLWVLNLMFGGSGFDK